MENPKIGDRVLLAGDPLDAPPMTIISISIQKKQTFCTVAHRDRDGKPNGIFEVDARELKAI